MYTFEIIKLQLKDFFDRLAIQKSTSLFSEAQQVYYSKELFLIEKHLNTLKEEFRVNQNIDCSIVSDSIIKSFENYKEAYKTEDYLLSFLIFLTKQENHDAERLKDVMDNYVELVKVKFGINDVLITASGAKRCFTNIRFALNHLRVLGLVYKSAMKNNRIVRTFKPTPLGYLLAMRVSNLSIDDVLETLEDKSLTPKHNFYKELNILKSDIKTIPTQVIDKLREKFYGDYATAFSEIEVYLNNVKKSDKI